MKIMKKKDIYEVSIKILGIIAAWQLIVSLIAFIFIFISFLSISTNTKFDFMGIFQTNYYIWYILPVVLYSLFSFLFLFKTDKILSVLKLTSQDEATFQIEKKTFYNIAVLIIGFFMFAYSGNQLSSNTFTNTKATTTTTGTAPNQRIEQATISSEQIKNTANISTTTTTTTLPTSSEQIKNSGNISATTSTTTSPTFSTTVNYISILIFLLSILIIIKSEKFSTMLMPKEKLID